MYAQPLWILPSFQTMIKDLQILLFQKSKLLSHNSDCMNISVTVGFNTSIFSVSGPESACRLIITWLTWFAECRWKRQTQLEGLHRQCLQVSVSYNQIPSSHKFNYLYRWGELYDGTCTAFWQHFLHSLLAHQSRPSPCIGMGHGRRDLVFP